MSLRTHPLNDSLPPYDDGAFAVAPMMDYTDRFLRFILRQLTSRATLYTEMVTANTLAHCSEAELPRFLGLGEAEQPLVLQLGGADPSLVRRAAAIASPWGFAAMNLNCGCPSDRVAGSGRFGAALMDEPHQVAAVCAALADGAGGQLPVTVKCRVGVTRDKARATEIDDEETYERLAQFVEVVSSRGGVRCFQVHARKAVLGGLSPAQNRQIPPLRYNLVHRLAADFPSLRFSLNGGIESLPSARKVLEGESCQLSGVMVGRAVVARPWDWAQIDTELYDEPFNPASSRRQVLDTYAAFADAEAAACAHNIRRLLLAPALNLFAGEPHGKMFRRRVDELASDPSISAGSIILRSAEDTLLAETLDAPPGYVWRHDERAYLPPVPNEALARTDTTSD
ncbi:hypothetical protein AB1Y20_013547 [Prymnesium parvum]|uniref:DUS-like FMN-binding domain-containing protein n=1 Tax=Prymnesium parvum TaxID=97485 RepID=A0AB34IJB9_PRYPA